VTALAAHPEAGHSPPLVAEGVCLLSDRKSRHRPGRPGLAVIRDLIEQMG
jgi:hypothetical protein